MAVVRKVTGMGVSATRLGGAFVVLVLASVAVYWVGFNETSQSRDPGGAESGVVAEAGELEVEPGASPHQGLDPNAVTSADPDREEVEGRVGAQDGGLAYGEIAGRVVNEAGEVIAGVRLTVGPARETQAIKDFRLKHEKAYQRATIPGTTDVQGSFAFPDIPAIGLWRLIATRGKYARTERRIEVRRGEVTEVEITMKVAGSASGKVINSAGHPLEGVTVKEGKWSPSPAEAVVTGPDGSFQLEGLWNTYVTIVAEKEGLAMGVPVHVTKKIIFGEDVGGIEIVMHPDRPIRGRIVSAVGVPVPGALVTCYAEVGNGISSVDNLRSDEAGRFELGPIPDVGTYRVDVTALGYRRIERNRVKPGASIEIQMDAASRIEVVPVSGDTGESVRPKLLALESVSGSERMKTRSRVRVLGLFKADQEGIETWPNHYFVPVDGSGTYQVRIEAEGYISAWTDVVELKATEDAGPYTVRMERGGQIRGIVVLAETGEPIQGAVVQLAVRGAEAITTGVTWSGSRRQRFFRTGQRRTNRQGRFSFDLLPEDRYAIRVDAKGYPVVLIEELRAFRGAELEPIRIEVPEGGSVFGTVVASDGNPLAAARVVARQANGLGISVVTDEGGVYRISPLAPGLYRVELGETAKWDYMKYYLDADASSSSLASGSEEYPVEIRVGDEVRIDFDQREGRGNIAGTVLVNGRPRTQLAVRVLPAGEPGGEAQIDSVLWKKLPVLGRSDESGSYRLRGVPVGKWDVLVTGGQIGLLAARRTVVTAGADQVLDFNIETCRLHGDVIDAETGMAVPRAEVHAMRIMDSKGGWATRDGLTSQAGVFDLDLLPAGDYTVEARMEGGISQRERVSLRSGEMMSIRLSIEPGGSIRIRIMPEGWVRRDISIRLTDESTGEPYRIQHERIDSDGSLLLPGVRPGTYGLRVSHRSLKTSGSAMVTVERKVESFAALTLTRDGN